MKSWQSLSSFTNATTGISSTSTATICPDIITKIASIWSAIAIAACAAGAHFLTQTFEAHGHTVKPIAPQYVKPFVKTNKNDDNDAEAISEAAMRPNRHLEPRQVSTG